MLAAVAGVFGDHRVSIRSMEQEGLGAEARLVFVTHSRRRARRAGLPARPAPARRGGPHRRPAPGRSAGDDTPAGGASSTSTGPSSRSSADTPVVTLLEGGTPLLAAPRLSERVGARVCLKIEGANPTGSFKDRGMTVAISKAVEEGAKAVVCASTGNTSASAAAYAARAGLTCAVLIPEGYIALGKLAQALIHGARVLQIRANFDAGLDIVRELGDRGAGDRRQLDQPVPHRGPEDRRLRDRRRARRRARRTTASRSATPATSPPTGRATASTRTPAG